MSQDRVGSSVGACPESAPEPEYMEPGPQDPKHRIEFHFKIESGQTIADSAGYELIHPSGGKEKGKLADGALERDGVPEGAYQMKFFYISDCSWEISSALGEPKVKMSVDTGGFPDGQAVTFQVFPRFHSRNEQPRAEFNASIRGNQAEATFHYKQQLKEGPGGEFVFLVKVGDKRAYSDPLEIRPYPLETLAGVQQRLKWLGYDPGGIDGIFGPKTEAAVKGFQRGNPPLAVDGIPGPLTQRELSQQ